MNLPAYLVPVKPLTPKQQNILIFIRDFWETEGFGPSIRDIAKGCNIPSTSTVAHHISALVDHDLIEYTPNIARTVRVK